MTKLDIQTLPKEEVKYITEILNRLRDVYIFRSNNAIEKNGSLILNAREYLWDYSEDPDFGEYREEWKFEKAKYIPNLLKSVKLESVPPVDEEYFHNSGDYYESFDLTLTKDFLKESETLIDSLERRIESGPDLYLEKFCESLPSKQRRVFMMFFESYKQDKDKKVTAKQIDEKIHSKPNQKLIRATISTLRKKLKDGEKYIINEIDKGGGYRIEEC